MCCTNFKYSKVSLEAVNKPFYGFSQYKLKLSLFPLSPTDPLKSRRVKKNYCQKKNRNFRKIDARPSGIGYLIKQLMTFHFGGH
jgi:hypothetical protein